MKRILALLTLHAADGLTTAVALSLGGHEIGTVMAPVLTRYGVGGMLVLSIIGVAVELAALAWLQWCVRAGLPERVMLVGWGIALGIATYPIISNALVIASS